jgi:hypothetical protein
LAYYYLPLFDFPVTVDVTTTVVLGAIFAETTVAFAIEPNTLFATLEVDATDILFGLDVLILCALTR